MNMFTGITILGSVLPLVYGCSPEGWVEPTLESKTHYAKIIVVGNVTEKIEKDPAKAVGETYGASVYVQCTYKGGIFPGYITIGGAGFIHGMCDAKDLEVGKRYILFLNEKKEGADYYMQSDAAERYWLMRELSQMCDLEMNYPEENGFMLKRRVCNDAAPKSSCKRYEEPKGVTDTEIVKGGKPEFPGDATTRDPGDGAKSFVANLGVVVMSVVFYLL